MTAPITATGTKGYLQWLRADQPQLYAQVAPVIAKQVPGVFTSYDQSRVMNYVSGLSGFPRAVFHGIGQSTDDEADTSEASVEPVDVDLETVASPDLTTDDIADVADSTAPDPSDSSTISSIVSTAADSTLSSYLSNFSAANSQALDAMNAGSTPPDVSTGGSLSTGTSGLSSTTVLIGAGAVLLLIALAAGG